MFGGWRELQLSVFQILELVYVDCVLSQETVALLIVGMTAAGFVAMAVRRRRQKSWERSGPCGCPAQGHGSLGTPMKVVVSGRRGEAARVVVKPVEPRACRNATDGLG